MFYQLKFSLV